MVTILKRSDTQTRETLAKAGFVHITGLTEHHILGAEAVIGNDLPARELGKWDQNNGKMVIITEGGEVWLAVASGSLPENFLRTVCPNGRGAYVPCSNGETIDFNTLLSRIANPEYILS